LIQFDQYKNPLNRAKNIQEILKEILATERTGGIVLQIQLANEKLGVDCARNVEKKICSCLNIL
jgi:signal transduction histidine kinase